MLRAFGQCAPPEEDKIKTREGGSIPAKKHRPSPNPIQALLRRPARQRNIEPGPEVVTAHLRAPQVHVAWAAPRDVPEGRIQFKLPLFFT